MSSPSKKRDPIAIGNRIKSTRMLSGKTRKSFALESGISLPTLRFWEEPPESGRSGLTDKGADRLIEAFHECGIQCTKDWLLYGKGFGPKLIKTDLSDFFEQIDFYLDEEHALLKDIENFKETNLESIVAIIPDDSMLPLFASGDYVGGIKKYHDDINKLIGLNCIIEFKDKILVRKLIAGESTNTFSLIILNHDSPTLDPVILNVRPNYAAEIIFHRWRSRAKRD
jgi:hypothetical protein